LEKQVALPLLGMTPELAQDKASEPIINLPFGKPDGTLDDSSIQLATILGIAGSDL